MISLDLNEVLFYIGCALLTVYSRNICFNISVEQNELLTQPARDAACTLYLLRSDLKKPILEVYFITWTLFSSILLIAMHSLYIMIVNSQEDWFNSNLITVS